MAREEEQALLDLIYKVWTNLGRVFLLGQPTIDISRSVAPYIMSWTLVDCDCLVVSL